MSHANAYCQTKTAHRSHSQKLGLTTTVVSILFTWVNAVTAAEATYLTLPVTGERSLPYLRQEAATLRPRAPAIMSMTFTSNTTITSVDGKGLVEQWNLEKPNKPQTLVDLQTEVVCAVLSDDAKVLAYAEQDGSVSLMELDSKKTRLRAAPIAERTVGLTLSTDRKRLANISDAGRVRLWDVITGEELKCEISAEPSLVQSVTFSRKGKQLAVGSFTNRVSVFNIESTQQPKVFDLGKSKVTAVAFSHDDKTLVIASSDGLTRVFDALGNEPPVSLGSRAFAVWRLAFDATGERLAAADWNGTIQIWNAKKWELIQSLDSKSDSVSALAFGLQGDLLSASVNGPLQYWGLEVPTLRATAMISGRSHSVWIANYSPDGETLFVGGREKRFELWDLKERRLLISRAGPATTRCAVFSPDGQTLVTGGDDGKVVMWNPQTGEPWKELSRHPGAVSAVVYTPDGKTLVSACDGGVVKVWNAQTGEENATWREHQHQIYCANITSDGQTLLTGGGDWTSDVRGELVVWDLPTGRVRARLDGHRLAIWSIAFTPDQQRFLTSCSSGEVKIWDLKTLKEVMTLPHSKWVRGLGISPDGKTLAVGVGDGSVMLWDTATWATKASLVGHESFTFFLQFAPSGEQLATSGNDGTVRFWPIR